MRVFVALALLAPDLLGVQEPVRRSWFTTIGDVWATRDGWVEWRVVRPGGPPAHHGPYPGTKAYFAPAAARTWVAAARRALADTSGGSSAGAVSRLRGGRAEISLTVHHDRARDRYDLQASSCNGGLGSRGTWREGQFRRQRGGELCVEWTHVLGYAAPVVPRNLGAAAS